MSVRTFAHLARHQTQFGCISSVLNHSTSRNTLQRSHLTTILETIVSAFLPVVLIKDFGGSQLSRAAVRRGRRFRFSESKIGAERQRG